MKTIRCPHCSKPVDKKAIRCRHCKMIMPMVPLKDPPPQTKSCPKCGGAGADVKNRQCKSCKGTGRVREQKIRPIKSRAEFIPYSSLTERRSSFWFKVLCCFIAFLAICVFFDGWRGVALAILLFPFLFLITLPLWLK